MAKRQEQHGETDTKVKAKIEMTGDAEVKGPTVKVGDREIPIPTGDLSIRALKEGFRRNGRSFGVIPQNFSAEELKWTPKEWREALNDPTLIFGDPVSGTERFGAALRERAKTASMYRGGIPGERHGGGADAKVPADEEDAE